MFLLLSHFDIQWTTKNNLTLHQDGDNITPQMNLNGRFVSSGLRTRCPDLEQSDLCLVHF